jgi:hypothetical protein
MLRGRHMMTSQSSISPQPGHFLGHGMEWLAWLPYNGIHTSMFGFMNGVLFRVQRFCLFYRPIKHYLRSGSGWHLSMIGVWGPCQEQGDIILRST